ncbi:MAG: hypothetical protein KAY32_17720 [Candidatus Eisenbacteria sp.]|nr:hypothetical protein [Candidatus Eisenbacteria bacterium]
MADKKRSAKELLVSMVCCWVGAAASGFAGIRELQRHDSDAWLTFITTALFLAVAIILTMRYRSTKQDLS